MNRPTRTQAVTGGSILTTLAALGLAASQAWESHEQTERVRIEFRAARVCEGQQIHDADRYHECLDKLAEVLGTDH